MADFIWKQGDVLPIITDSLTYSNEESVNLEGAQVKFVMRALTAAEQVKLTGEAKITTAKEGKVSFTPSVSDTSTVGNYMANWVVTFAGGEQMTFPTAGYLWVEIEENLTHKGGQLLVSLPDVKDYLTIPANDRIHDQKLIRYIEAVGPIIENIVGPIRLIQREEWHNGGNYFIQLRRRPSTAFGTSPVIHLIACSEFRGPIEYPLSIIQDPAHGSIYSCFLEPLQGVVTRRTSGGGVMAFPPMAESVHVVYQAGQETVPANIYEATLELIRVNWSTTMAVGRGSMSLADENDTGPPLGYFVPRRVRELLAPMKKHPSIA